MKARPVRNGREPGSGRDLRYLLLYNDTRWKQPLPPFVIPRACDFLLSHKNGCCRWKNVPPPQQLPYPWQRSFPFQQPAPCCHPERSRGTCGAPFPMTTLDRNENSALMIAGGCRFSHHHLVKGTGALQIPPLRCAPVEMTKERVVTSMRSGYQERPQ
jgi:hypothetical protein